MRISDVRRWLTTNLMLAMCWQAYSGCFEMIVIMYTESAGIRYFISLDQLAWFCISDCANKM